MDLGVSKWVTAHIIQSAAAAYAEQGDFRLPDLFVRRTDKVMYVLL